jgi:hypothetical protein
MMKIIRPVVAGLSLALSIVGCRPISPVLSPRPAELRELEGYASLKITINEQTAKSKFSFNVALPLQARLQVLDMLNRPLYELIVEGDASYFVLSSKRAYWQGTTDEVFEKFLGFRLSLREMAGLLSGGWGGGREEEPILEGWAFEKDEQGRVVSGEKQDFQFRVREFDAGSRVPRQLTFKSLQSEGRLSLFSIQFNKPLKSGLFSPAALKGFALVSWEEIERILKNED